MVSVAEPIIFLHECKPLSARITVRQCIINRRKALYSCSNCPGLGEDIVEAVQVKEDMVMAKKQIHPKCIVAGCTKVRVAKCDGMCRADFKKYGSREAYYASVEMQETPGVAEAETIPNAASPYASALKKFDQEYCSAKNILFTSDLPPKTSLLSRVPLAPVPAPPETRPGFYLDFTGREDLLYALQEDTGVDLPRDVVFLLGLLHEGKLQRVAE